MTDLPESEVMRLARRHRSIRKYTGESIDRALLERLIECGQGAATSSFVQAYSVVLVTDPDKRAAIAAAAGGQVWIERAAAFLIYCADLNRVEQACLKAGRGALEGCAEHSVVALVDVALMAENVLLAAESVGLGGVFIGGIRNDPALVSQLLELPEKVVPVFGMCLGWPDQDTAVKPRLPVAAILHENRYDRSRVAADIDSYDTVMGEYYRSRNANTKASHWSAETAKAVQGKKREHMHEFLNIKGFFLR